MSEYIEVGQPLQFTDPNTPTRAGEIVENVSDIYNIPSPRLGMQVFVKSEKKSFVITSLKSKVVNGVDVPEAAVEAFEPVGVKSITWNNDTDQSNMNDFVTAGVYDIKGEHTREDDNLPILNTGGGHSFNARLTVLDSSISGSGNSDDKCITQVLSFSNRLGQGEVYIRTGKGSSLYNLTWENWSTLQRNVNVGEVGSLDDLKDNGIYSGVWKQGRINPNHLAFVCIVINDYFIGIAPRRVSQFVYGLSKSDGSVVYQSRVWDDSKGMWGNWEILNQKEIASMISAEIKKVTDGIDPNKIDSLKDIITWIEEHGDVAGILAAIEGLYDELGREIDARISVDNDTRGKGVLFGGFSNRQTTADEVFIGYKNIDQKAEGAFAIPAATTEKAGVMSAKDKEVINKLSSSLSEERPVTVGKFINLDNITVGGSLNISEISQGTYAYFKEECLSGDVFVVTTSGNNGFAAKSYAILDSNNVILALGDDNSLTNEVIIIPDGGAVLIVNSLKTGIKVNKVIDKAASVGSVKEIDNRFLKNIPFTKSNSYYSLYSAAVGSVLTESIINANGCSYAKIECSEGEEYILSTNGNTSGAKSYAILDSNNIVLALGNTTALVDETVIIPEGGKTLIVNSKTAGASIKKTLAIPSIGYDGENLVIDDLIIPLSGENSGEEYTSIVQYADNGYINLYGVTVGSNVSIKEVDATVYSYILLPVLKGDRFRVVVPSGGTSSARICCVTDKNLLCTFLVTTSSFDGEVEIIEDGYIIINAKDIDSCVVDKLGEIKECKTNIPYTKKDCYIPLTDIAIGSQYGLAQSSYTKDFCYAICRVYAGQQFSITTTGNTKHAKSYAIFDNSMKCLAFATSAQTDRCITIWQDGYLVVNSKIEGFSFINIDTISQKLNTEVFNELKSEVVDARRYTVSDYNNSANFDEAYIGDTKTCALYLEYNRNIPTKGAVISRDISGKRMSAEHTLEEAQAFVVPYLFYNQQKVGTIVLYDETTGNPFIFDKNGNKKFLSYE